MNIIRHAVLSAIKFYKKKYSREYGETVLACDNPPYWRKDIFPHYKARRKDSRDKSDLDWKLIFDTISVIREDLAENFTYKVIYLNGLEGDDIIAALTEWTQTNGIIDRGFFEEKQPVLIVSSDKDHFQLHKYDNVKQWSPKHKKFIQPETTAEEALMEKICCGDSGDGYGNILSDDDVFVAEGKRQTPFRKSRLSEFYKKGIEACASDVERRNFQRNELMASYDKIPANLKQLVVSEFENYTITGSKMKIFDYLVKNRCGLLLEDIDLF